MPVKATPQSATQKWLSGIQGSTQRITDGVQRVQQAPGQAAAAQKQVWLQQVTQAADKWAANTAAVSLQQWQTAMTSVGIPRIAAGASAKQQKMTDFMAKFLPYLQSGVSQVDRMPKGGLENGIARATAMIRYNAGFKRNS